MFQNLDRNVEEDRYNVEQEMNNKTNKLKEFIKESFSIQKIILYTVAFMVSLVSFGTSKELAPFSVAMLVAILSSSNPIALPFIIIGISNTIAFGFNSTLSYILISLILFFSILIKAPRYDDENNEKRKMGLRLFFTCLIVKLAGLLFREIMVYDILLAVMYSIAVFIFYKIFTNAIPVITKFGEKHAYSIEEVMGASLTLAIAISSIGNYSVFGYSLKNILCILIVLIMGWKNGILVGGTAGITVGTVLGVIGAGDISQIASYALSGMVAGIFSKFGKLGVIFGFIIGNIALSYFSNGNTAQIINMQEILIASLGLLAIPKKIKINIEEIYETKLLPETTSRSLEENKDTVYKLTTMSETLSEIAKSYKEAAATIVDEDELKQQEKENYRIFEKELQNNIEGIQENILYDDLYSPKEGFLEDVFEKLLENEMLVEKDLVEIFAKYNNYIIINKENKDEITQVVKIINYSYRVSKLNFIWKKKMDENKKAVSNQFKEVSNAIESLAEDIDKNNNIKDEFANVKESLLEELKELDLNVNSVSIVKDVEGRTVASIYTNTCQSVENPSCNLKKMNRIVNKVLNKKMELQNQECGLRLNLDNCVHTFVSANKQELQIGIATAVKEDSSISGDSNIQTRLKDGKYLVAISDGMGSRKRSKKE